MRAPRMLRSVLLGGAEQLGAVEDRRPADPGAAGEAGDGLGRDALAGAGLADDGEGGAALDVEGQPPDGVDHAVRGVELDVQVADLE